MRRDIQGTTKKHGLRIRLIMTPLTSRGASKEPSEIAQATCLAKTLYAKTEMLRIWATPARASKL